MDWILVLLEKLIFVGVPIMAAIVFIAVAVKFFIWTLSIIS